MAELKKCPHCGGEAKLFQHYPYMRKRVVSSVCCKKCRANSGTWGRKDKAIEAWNNRATEAEIRTKAIEEFSKLLIGLNNEFPTVEDDYGEIRPMWIEEMCEKIALQMKGEKE